MDLVDFIDLAKEFTNLGWSVANQLENVASGNDRSDQNPEALRIIRRYLRNLQGYGVDCEHWIREIEYSLEQEVEA